MVLLGIRNIWDIGDNKVSREVGIIGNVGISGNAGNVGIDGIYGLIRDFRTMGIENQPKTRIVKREKWQVKELKEKIWKRKLTVRSYGA